MEGASAVDIYDALERKYHGYIPPESEIPDGIEGEGQKKAYKILRAIFNWAVENTDDTPEQVANHIRKEVNLAERLGGEARNPYSIPAMN